MTRRPAGAALFEGGVFSNWKGSPAPLRSIWLYYTPAVSTVKARVLKFIKLAKIVYSFFKISPPRMPVYGRRGEGNGAERLISPWRFL